MYCKECGVKIDDGKFCSECGTPINQTKSKPKEGPDENTVDTLLALIIPILGIFIGINNLVNPKKDNGPLIIVISLFGFFIWYLLFSVIFYLG